MSEVVKQDEVISNCVGETNSDKLLNENCHTESIIKRDDGLVKDVDDLDEGELGRFLTLYANFIELMCLMENQTQNLRGKKYLLW